MKSTRTYENFAEFLSSEPEVVKSLISDIKENYEIDVNELTFECYNWSTRETSYVPMESMNELTEYLKEESGGGGNKEVDSCYITRTYIYETNDNKFTLEVIGQQYLKDQTICDEEMLEEVTVIDKALQKAEKKVEKAAKKADEKKKWEDLFDIHDDLAKLKSELLNNYKFPTRLK